MRLLRSQLHCAALLVALLAAANSPASGPTSWSGYELSHPRNLVLRVHGTS
jgi:hypothetical protein